MKKLGGVGDSGRKLAAIREHCVLQQCAGPLQNFLDVNASLDSGDDPKKPFIGQHGATVYLLDRCTSVFSVCSGWLRNVGRQD